MREFRMVVEGPFACFTRVDLKVERVSYDIITPSAARNIIQAIYWHPGVVYKITQIDLLAPIKHLQMTRNELKSKLSARNALRASNSGKDFYLDPAEDIMQRSAIILKDVKYCIHFRVGINDKANPGDTIVKYTNILMRRAQKGQCYTQPYLGLKEFSAKFHLLDSDEEVKPLPVNKEMGLMLYDLDYRNPENIHPTFFFANLKDGTMNLRHIRLLR